MKTILTKMSKAVQVVLAAPVRLPSKVVTVAKYVAVALGILESVIPDKEDKPKIGEEESGETAD